MRFQHENGLKKKTFQHEQQKKRDGISTQNTKYCLAIIENLSFHYAHIYICICKVGNKLKKYSLNMVKKRTLSWRMISGHIWWLAPNLEFPISNEAGGQIFDVAIAGQYFDFMSTQHTEVEKRWDIWKHNICTVCWSNLNTYGQDHGFGWSWYRGCNCHLLPSLILAPKFGPNFIALKLW